MSSLVKGSNCQGWRFFLYGIILVYLLAYYSEDDDLLGAMPRENNGISPIVGNNIGVSNTISILNSPRRQSNREAPNVSWESVDNNPRTYEDNSFVEDEIKNLMKNRKSIYDDSRTLTVSEVAELHSVKNEENYPFAITNEAQLVLRELAIEHRIPEECTEEISPECLVILERSQAGTMPFECQDPKDHEECEKGFSRFWE